jgi:hypothetical protein
MVSTTLSVLAVLSLVAVAGSAVLLAAMTLVQHSTLLQNTFFPQYNSTEPVQLNARQERRVAAAAAAYDRSCVKYDRAIAADRSRRAPAVHDTRVAANQLAA